MGTFLLYLSILLNKYWWTNEAKKHWNILLALLLPKVKRYGMPPPPSYFSPPGPSCSSYPYVPYPQVTVFFLENLCWQLSQVLALLSAWTKEAALFTFSSTCGGKKTGTAFTKIVLLPDRKVVLAFSQEEHLQSDDREWSKDFFWNRYLLRRVCDV